MSSEDYQKVDESIVGTLQNGRYMIRSKRAEVVRGGILKWYFQIDFTKLNTIDALLDLQVRSTSPAQNIASIEGKTISRHSVHGHPVVGFTVFGIPSGITATGTTVCVECVAVGW